ncbi:MAG: hypothetical protein ACO1QR_00210 [Chthoniobacteraceae bacterium]
MRYVLWTVVAVMVAIGALALLVIQPGGSGVLASIRTPDGSEYMVTQRCNWGPDPYTVDFYMREPGKAWGWCYIDHEAMRWSDVKLVYDNNTDSVSAFKNGVRKAVLDRKTREFWFDNGDGNPRTARAPMEARTPNFAFHLVNS